jgi:hypothetical protein
MMAGPTTQASTPIGTVTLAQMARIFVREYCLVSAASSTRAGSGCVFVMSSALPEFGLCRSAIGPDYCRR